MKTNEQQISPWSFYDQKLRQKQEEKTQRKQTIEQHNIANKISKQSFTIDLNVKYAQKIQTLLKNPNKYQKQSIVLKVAKLTQIQSSARVQYQSKRYFQKIKTLILLKMIKRKLHQQSDNIIQNVLNIQKLSNQQIHHDGIFFPKVYAKQIPGHYQELSPQNKSKQIEKNDCKQIKRSLSQINHILQGDLNNQFSEYRDSKSDLPLFQKRFSKAYRRNGSVLKNIKVINF